MSEAELIFGLSRDELVVRMLQMQAESPQMLVDEMAEILRMEEKRRQSKKRFRHDIVCLLRYSVKNDVDSDVRLRYTSVGQCMKEDRAMIELARTFHEARQNRSKHFFLVDECSGTGKTQLPFTLAAMNFKVLHLTMVVFGGGGQKIYESLMPKSIKLDDCIYRDFCNTLNDTDMDDIDACHDNLATVAFFFQELMSKEEFEALLGDEHDACDQKFSPEALKCFIDSLPIESRPIVFLDEALSRSSYEYTADSQDVKRVRFVRDLLRHVGLVVVVMGTNSSKANFTVARNLSENTGSDVWCKLIPRLPKPNEASLACLGVTKALDLLRCTGHSSVAALFREQFKTCIPWFAELFAKVTLDLYQDHMTKLEKMCSCDALNNILGGISDWIFMCKAALQTYNGLRGQLLMHLAGHKVGVSPALISEQDSANLLSRKSTSYLVACHFASLNYEENLDLSAQNESLIVRHAGGDFLWMPSASFPHAAHNALLYLTLAGGHKFPPCFVYDDNAFTTYQVFCIVLGKIKKNTLICGVDLGCPDAYSKHGNVLEALAAVALEIASHRNGVGGVKLDDFLRFLTLELLPRYYKEHSWNDAFSPGAYFHHDFLQSIMPYLSPVNSPWPDYFNEIDGCKFATLWRIPHINRINFDVVDHKITGEARSNKIVRDAVMKDILACVPSDSTLHLVFVSKLQSTYFSNATSWEEFRVQYSNIQDACLLKVMESRKSDYHCEISLVPLFDGAITDNMKYTRAVIFFPINHLYKKSA